MTELLSTGKISKERRKTISILKKSRISMVSKDLEKASKIRKVNLKKKNRSLKRRTDLLETLESSWLITTLRKTMIREMRQRILTKRKIQKSEEIKQTTIKKNIHKETIRILTEMTIKKIEKLQTTTIRTILSLKIKRNLIKMIIKKRERIKQIIIKMTIRRR